MRLWVVGGALLIAGCNAGAPPPGTGPVTIQQFTVVNTDAPLVFCQGTYERVYGAVTTSAVVLCDDGRTGKLRLNTLENGHPVSGLVRLSDGARSSVAFLPNLTDGHAYGRAPSLHRAAGRPAPRRGGSPSACGAAPLLKSRALAGRHVLSRPPASEMLSAPAEKGLSQARRPPQEPF